VDVSLFPLTLTFSPQQRAECIGRHMVGRRDKVVREYSGGVTFLVREHPSLDTEGSPLNTENPGSNERTGAGFTQHVSDRMNPVLLRQAACQRVVLAVDAVRCAVDA